MINEMDKLHILHLLKYRIKALKSTTNDMNTYCTNIDKDDYKVLILTSQCLLNEFNDLYNILYNLEIRYYEDKNIKTIVKSIIKELISIESYILNFYLLAIEYENLNEFLNEYKNEVEDTVTNLVKYSHSLKDIQNGK